MNRRIFLKTLVAGSTAYLLERDFTKAGSTFDRHKVWLPYTPFDAPPGSWTFAVLPDTQYYSRKYPYVFMRQTQWIAAHAQTHQIRFVAHEGDLVTNPTHPRQWRKAQKALSVLSNAGIPFSIVPGNHDLGTQYEGLTNSRSTLLNNYFQPSDYRNSESYGLFEPEKMENSWHEVSTPTGKHLVVALEFGPRDEVLAWANTVVTQKPNHKVIVVTHSYLYSDNKVSDWAYDQSYGGRGNPKIYPFAETGNANDGRDMWDKFIAKHPQISFVLNGHVCDQGTGYLKSVGESGNTVHQILANYQDNSPDFRGTVLPPRGVGGGGFMRLMQFHPDGMTVRVRTYSPWYNQWLTEPNQDFTLSLAFPSVYKPVLVSACQGSGVAEKGG